MANQIQIKRSSSTAVPTSLQAGELAYSGNGEILYIGSVNGAANTANVVAIAGARNPGVLTANQAIVANSLSWVNTIQTSKLIVGTTSETVNVTSISVSANTTQLGASATGSNTELASTYAIKTYVDGKVAAAIPVLTSTQIGFGNSTNYLTGNTSLTFNAATATISVGNSSVNTTISQTAITTNTLTTGAFANIGGDLTVAGNTALNGKTTFGDAVSDTVVFTAKVDSNLIPAHGTTHYLGNTSLYWEYGYISHGVLQDLVVAGTVDHGNTTITGFANLIGASATFNASTGVNGATEFITTTAAHGFANGDLVRYIVSTGNTAVSGLANATNYYVVGANTTAFQLAATRGGAAINLAAGTSETGHTLYPQRIILDNTTGNISSPIGLANVGSLNVIGTSTLGGVATFNANASFGANVSVTNSLSANVLTVTDATVSGNLTVNGTLTTINTTNLNVSDPLIRVANGNATTDTVDVGFYGSFGNTTVTQYTGLFRDASDSGIYKLFTGQIPDSTTTVDTANVNFAYSTLQSYLKTGGSTASGLIANATHIAVTANSTLNVTITANTLTLATALAVGSGGTGATTFTTKGVIYGNGTSALQVTSAGTDGQVLQANSTGFPVFATLDGGTF